MNYVDCVAGPLPGVDFNSTAYASRNMGRVFSSPLPQSEFWGQFAFETTGWLLFSCGRHNAMVGDVVCWGKKGWATRYGRSLFLEPEPDLPWHVPVDGGHRRPFPELDFFPRRGPGLSRLCAPDDSRRGT